MKLVSYVAGGNTDFGVISSVNGRIVPLGKETQLPDLAALLARGLDGINEAEAREGDLDLGEVQLLPPIPEPKHLFGIGLNTYSHLVEAGRPRSDAPKHPMVFIRFPSSVVGDGAELKLPADVTTFDYEGEVALVIGKGGRNIPVEDAMDHIVGYSCFNDGSMREYQRHSTQVGLGKNFDASGAWGPWIVTKDEAPAAEEIVLTTFVNGDQKQQMVWDDLIFNYAELVAYISQGITLQPGDVIATGAAAGVGVFTGAYLRPGDHVEMRLEGVGSLNSPVVGDVATSREG